MTSSAHDADLKGNNFRPTIHPQIFISVAFIFSELDRGGFRGPAPPPPPPVQKIEKSLVWIGLNKKVIKLESYCQPLSVDLSTSATHQKCYGTIHKEKYLPLHFGLVLSHSPLLVQAISLKPSIL